MARRFAKVSEDEIVGLYPPLVFTKSVDSNFRAF